MEPTLQQLNTYTNYLHQLSALSTLQRLLVKYQVDVLNPESDVYEDIDWDDEDLTEIREKIADIDLSTLESIEAGLDYQSNDEGGSDASIDSFEFNFAGGKTLEMCDWELYENFLASVGAEAFEIDPIRIPLVKPFNLLVVE